MVTNFKAYSVVGRFVRRREAAAICAASAGRLLEYGWPSALHTTLLKVPCKLEVIFLDNWVVAVVRLRMNQFGVARRSTATKESSELEARVGATGAADAHLSNGSAFMHPMKPEKKKKGRRIHIFLSVTLFRGWSSFPEWRRNGDSDAEREVRFDENASKFFRSSRTGSGEHRVLSGVSFFLFIRVHTSVRACTHTNIHLVVF